jgi:hypothetical protein
MPTINISEETHARLKAFLPLAVHLNDGPVPVDHQAEFLIIIGMELLLRTLWERQEPQTLVESLVKLSQRHPEQLFQFVTDVLAAGGQQAQEIKEQFGFGRWRPKQG